MSQEDLLSTTFNSQYVELFTTSVLLNNKLNASLYLYALGEWTADMILGHI